ncbi:gamma-glutamyl-gamma-aminobutyrate hydrolase family protein [Legionella clemsonensis]|uniref:Glutamine amidotransferase n=1 Tax=Legionella clemsonensis TaxID=1867846 RepID=A0A222P2D5_9GAMM|nr:gamma-glutamyl-gamma-aminobutyrate hydrolase family protein [Legionella clemsonensis]ASQ45925.1 Putative glutamine amidotransferase [Legionella clemsonensis]
MKTRPVIAITYSNNQSKIVIGAIKLAIWLSGGTCLCVNTRQNQDNFNYDGLLLCGGVDITPDLYGSSKKANYLYDFERDKLELKHLFYAERHNLPVLGICRGCQLMNVYRKGTLYTDIEKVFEEAQYPSHLLGYLFFRKQIQINPRSLLFKITRKISLKVNSIHKQSIFNLGHNLKIGAIEKNNIIQSIEDPSKKFFLGVQFHPEFLIYKISFLNLFKEFVNSTRRGEKEIDIGHH